MHIPNTSLLALAVLFLPSTLAAGHIECRNNALIGPAGIAECAQFLTSLGQQACVTFGGVETIFCERQGAVISGIGYLAHHRAGERVSFPCIDVAVAVGHILDTCTVDIFPRGLQCAGQATVDGVVKMAVHAFGKTCKLPDGSNVLC